jgi:hypothetical protein
VVAEATQTLNTDIVLKIQRSLSTVEGLDEYAMIKPACCRSACWRPGLAGWSLSGRSGIGHLAPKLESDRQTAAHASSGETSWL